MKGLFTLIFTLCFFGLSAQKQHPAKGLSILQDEINVYTLPTVDNEALLEAELALPSKGRATKFAEPFTTSITPDNAGTWENIGDLAVWRLRVSTSNAKNLNFGFTQYRMPENGALFVYSTDRRDVIGPFTAKDNEVHNQLWTPIISGKESIIEVSLPISQKENLVLEIGQIAHGFKDADDILSGSCNVDVICGSADGFPEIDNHRDIIRSAAVYSINGFLNCSGSLINNAREDCTPYYLTADHCGVSANNAPSIVVYWNYENSVCRAPNSSASGQGGNGSLATFNTGSVRRATYGNSDFTLVELDDPVNEDANAYFAGWSREDIVSSSAIAIHHPNLEEKRISFEDAPTVITNYSSQTPNTNGTHHMVTDWDLGTTEGGSSGSPLFDQNERVIGQLTGGGAACGNDAPDWYGRMTINWEGGGTANSRLKDWLDPDNTGVMFVNGKEATSCGFAVIALPFSQDVCSGTDVNFNLEVSDNFTSNVSMNVAGLPTGATTSFSSNPAVPGSNVTLTISTNGVAAGNYSLTINSTGGGESSTSAIEIIVSDGIPSTPSLSLPANNAIDVSINPSLEWTGDMVNISNSIEISTDNAFSNIVAMGNTDGTLSYSDAALESTTLYYWRVKSTNTCGESSWSSIYSFTTATVSCQLDNNNTQVSISNGPPNSITSTINIVAGGNISDVDVSIMGTHSFISDLAFTLTSPTGTDVILLANPCGNQNDFNISFDDGAASNTPPCPPTDGNSYQPQGSLSDFNGEMATGTWTLTVTDNANQDGGTLDSWDLEICTSGTVSNDDLFIPSFSITPNPSNGEISIQLSQQIDTYQGEILSMDGRSVHSFQMNDAQKDINLSHLAKGVYLILLSNENNSIVEKLILK